LKSYIPEGIEAMGMAVIAWGLYGLATWAGIIAAGVFLVVIGAALGRQP
jgi:hypothetical protein